MWLPPLGLCLLVGGIVWHATEDSLADLEVDVAKRTTECLTWVDSMRSAGFRVRVRVLGDQQWRRDWESLHLPADVKSCHIAHQLRGKQYLLIGNIPARTVNDLFSSQPSVTGLMLREVEGGSGNAVWSFGGKVVAGPWPRNLPATP